jgi:hypothetical protein
MWHDSYKSDSQDGVGLLPLTYYINIGERQMAVYVNFGYISTMFRELDYKKTVKVCGHTYGVMVLPVYSLSGPNRAGMHRIVFDWGIGLSHPRANVAIAILDSPYGQHIDSILYKNLKYKIGSRKIEKCRSGKLSAYLYDYGPIDPFSDSIIKKLLAQEFK